MTNWLPELARSGVPLYREIADRLASDVAEGRLAPGTRLPTHRDLAWRLGVTVGTVSRAYAEAERRGLIGGTVGRGTFVLPEAGTVPDQNGTDERAGFVDLSVNYAITGSETRALADALAGLAAQRDLASLLGYQPHAGNPRDRQAGAAFCRSLGLDGAEREQILVTNGGQHAIALLLAGLTRPGDTVAVERLTYPGFKAAAQHSGLQPIGLDIDADGLRPDSLAAFCRAQPVRLLYLMPTLHNPTTATMPEARRREIAEICRQHEVAVVEDDVYGFLRPSSPAPLVTFLPERGFYLTSLSKAYVPGLRVGYICAPPREVDRIAAALHVSTYMASPITAVIARSWIEDGTGERMIAAKRALAASRQVLARSILGPVLQEGALTADPAALHCWAALPPPWRGDEFAAALRRRGVGVTPGSAFAAGPELAGPEAVRICLGTADSPEQLASALKVVAETLATSPGAYLSVV